MTYNDKYYIARIARYIPVFIFSFPYTVIECPKKKKDINTLSASLSLERCASCFINIQYTGYILMYMFYV